MNDDRRLTRESPVNPLIAENLPYTPVLVGYAFVIPSLVVALYIAGYYSEGLGGMMFLSHFI